VILSWTYTHWPSKSKKCTWWRLRAKSNGVGDRRLITQQQASNEFLYTYRRNELAILCDERDWACWQMQFDSKSVGWMAENRLQPWTERIIVAWFRSEVERASDMIDSTTTFLWVWDVVFVDSVLDVATGQHISSCLSLLTINRLQLLACQRH